MIGPPCCRRACLAGILMMLVAAAPAADPAAAITVGGDVRKPLVVDVGALRALPADAQVSFRSSREVDGQTQVSLVKGVRLSALLKEAALAENDRFDWRKTVVVAIARDGYRAVFSWPELFNTDAGAQVMVGYERDGAPLADGPLVVLAPGDIRLGPRHVKWLQRIEVRTLRE